MSIHFFNRTTRKDFKCMRKLLCFLLSVIMILGIFLVAASASNIVDSGVCGDNLTWSLENNGTLIINGNGTMNDYSFWKNRVENGVEDKHYVYFSNVDIHDGCTNIGHYAFADCLGLVSVSMPNSVTNIGAFAFSNCNFTSITLSNSIINIFTSAFYKCENLTSITIPDGVTTISDHTFYKCKSLKSVAIPGSIKNINVEAFEDCTSLTDVYYFGTEAQWNTIEIAHGNDGLLNATFHYNVTPTPETTAITETPASTVESTATEVFTSTEASSTDAFTTMAPTTVAQTTADALEITKTSPTTPAQPAVTAGDINGDGKVTSSDARFALRAAARLEKLNEQQKLAADVNHDGKVNSVDARILLRVAARLQTL